MASEKSFRKDRKFFLSHDRVLDPYATFSFRLGVMTLAARSASARSVNVDGCTNLASLMDAIGELGSLIQLYMGNCLKLEKYMNWDVHQIVSFFWFRLVDYSKISSKHMSDGLKVSFVNHVMLTDSNAKRISAAVRKYPRFSEITNAKGGRNRSVAIDPFRFILGFS